jgi:uncharacterized protein YkwD
MQAHSYLTQDRWARSQTQACRKGQSTLFHRVRHGVLLTLGMLVLTGGLLAQPFVMALSPSQGAGNPQAAIRNTEALDSAGAPTRSQYFAATGKSVQGGFLGTFERYGLERIGYPLTEERSENGRTVQYFERVRMEFHPELAGKGYSVLMTRLGADMTGARFARVAPFKSTASKAYFPETGHSLAEPFLSYWKRNGALELFGYPISELVAQDGITVQWFERARFEYHPELARQGKSVQLTHLGTLALQKVDPNAARVQPQPQAQPQAARPAEVGLSDLEKYLFDAINGQRTAAGLRPVQADGPTTDLSRARSTDMADRNYFSHSTPEGDGFLNMMGKRGIGFKYAGEILARNNYPAGEAAKIAIESYLKSAPHRAILMDGRYNYVGVGYSLSAEDEMSYFTVIFVER